MPSVQTEVDFSGQFSEQALDEVRRRRLLIERCDAWLFSTVRPYIGQRILEIGSGHGNLVRLMLDRELVIATDIELSAVDVLKAAFEHQTQVESMALDITDSKSVDLKSRSLDTVISLNVFEHIERDDRALHNIHEILIPGGRVVLIVPAHMWLYGSMDSSIGHWRRYDKKMMSDRMTQAGFAVTQLRYMNALGTLGWFVNGRILRQAVPPSGQLKLFNLIMPLVEAVESRVEPPIGLSLLAVGQRS